MRKLILIKHSKPFVDPQLASHKWKLSDEGRERCAALVDMVKPHAPAFIVASTEPKAEETAKILAEKLAIPFETAAGLQEHDRSNVPHMESREFISHMALFFKQPERLVLGKESAQQALDRFSAAANDAMQKHAEGNLAIVTHGTVLALLIASKSGEEAFPLWRRMGLPSMIVYELPEWKEVDRMERMPVASDQ